MKLECCICAEKIGEGGRQVSSTKCGHLFHKECIGAWLTQTVIGTCPQCRTNVANKDLRNIYFNNLSSRNSDIFNSSIVVNLRDVQEDLCIMQTNLEHEIQHLKTENEVMKERNDDLALEIIKLKAENIKLKAENAKKDDKTDDLLLQIKKLENLREEKMKIAEPKDENENLPSKSTRFGTTIRNASEKPISRLRKPTKFVIHDLSD